MKINIVYIDDEPDLCENFLDNFSSPEISVSVFTDWEKAVDFIKKTPPDLIFIDYRLPATTGDKIAMTLDPKIPKFLITGEISVEPQYPFVKIFPKPFSEKQISDAISEFILMKQR